MLSLTLALLFPVMLGLALGLVFGRGLAMLLLLPLLFAFVLMVTSVTYQFQGWLASLMVNKRRRRTIMAFLTTAIILLSQLPNLINVFKPWKIDPADSVAQRQRAATEQLQRDLQSGQIDVAEYN